MSEEVRSWLDRLFQKEWEGVECEELWRSYLVLKLEGANVDDALELLRKDGDGESMESVMMRVIKSVGGSFYQWVPLIRHMSDENILTLMYGGLDGDKYDRVISKIRQVKREVK